MNENEGGSRVETDDMIPENPIVVYPTTEGTPTPTPTLGA